MFQYSILQKTPRQPGFFVRQLDRHPTPEQRTFDVVFGVILPVICFELDPIVFKADRFFEVPAAGDYQFLVYLFSAIQITAMVIWLTFGSRLKPIAVASISGVFVVGGLVSFLIGVLILPLSLLGLIILVGAAGFTPFLTGFAYVRSAVRAFRACSSKASYPPLLLVATASALIALAVPLAVNAGVQSTVSRSITTILHGPIPEAEDAIEHLRWMPLIRYSERRRFLSEYQRQMNPDRRELIRRAYRAIFDQPVERDIMNSYD